MATPRITVGIPAYNCADQIGGALECLQQQTFGDFEAIISVDGNDTETAEACRPFLADPRFRMVVQPVRLDWVGNFNWLLRQDLKEYFCYRQADDKTAPEFFEVLLQTAGKQRDAAAIYCDCKITGDRNYIEIARSITDDEPLERIFEYIERMPWVQGPPIRGLVRTAAIRQAGGVRSDEFRAMYQIHGWLAKLLGWGKFVRVARALYYRTDHEGSFTRTSMQSTENRWHATWATRFTSLIDGVDLLCRGPAERQFFRQMILSRIIVYPKYCQYTDFASSKPLVDACLKRMIFEGLLRDEEVPFLLQGLKELCDEIKTAERSMIPRALFQIRQRAKFSELIHPDSNNQRLKYRARHLRRLLERDMAYAARRIGKSLRFSNQPAG